MIVKLLRRNANTTENLIFGISELCLQRMSFNGIIKTMNAIHAINIK